MKTVPAWATLCCYSATALNLSATMSGPKKRKVDSEGRVFNKEWTTKYFFTEVRSKAVCLFLLMEYLKRKMQGEDLYDSVSEVIKRHKLP